MGLRWFHILGFAAVVVAMAFLVLPPEREEGILLARSGNTDAAEKRLLRIIQHNPSDSLALLELAEGYMRAGQNEKGDALLEQFMRTTPNPARFNQRIGRIYATGLEYEKAIHYLSVNLIENREELISLSLRAGLNDEAIRFLRLRLKGTPADAETWKVILNLQQWQMNPDGIGEALDELAHVDPTMENISEALNFFYWQNNTDKMREYAALLGKLPDKPGDPQALQRQRMLRTIWVQLKDLKPALAVASAITGLPQAIEQDYIDLMSIQRWSGDGDGALQTLRSGLQRFPDNETMLASAVVLLRARKDFAASAELEVRLSRLTKDPSLLRSAAESFEQAQLPEQAISIYQNLIDARTAEGRDYYRLALLTQKTGSTARSSGALSSLRDFLLNHAGSANVTQDDEEFLLSDSLALLGQAGRNEDRQTILEAYTKGGNPAAVLLLCDLLIATGQPQEALRLLQQFPAAASADQKRQALVLVASLQMGRVYAAKDEKLREALFAPALTAIRAAITATDAMLNAPSSDPAVTAALRQSGQDLRQDMVDLLIFSGDLGAAATELAALSSPAPESLVDLAAAYADLNDIPNTRLWVKRVPASATLDAARMGRYGYALLTAGGNRRALEILQQADRMAAGKDKSVRIYLARAYGANGDIVRQYEILDAYAAQPSATEEDWIAAADARDQNEDIRDGLRVLELGLMRRPDSALLKARQVSLLSYMGLRKEARVAASNLSGMRVEKEAGALISVAYALLAVEQLREAERVLLIAERLPKPGPEVVLARARCAMAKRDLRIALPLYKEYLGLRESDAAAWLELAQLRKEMGLQGQREAALQSRRLLAAERSATTSDPVDGLQEPLVRPVRVTSLLLAGGIADFLGEREEALRNQQAAAARQPDVPARPLGLAALYNAYGKPVRATAAAQNALHYYPESAQAKRELASAQLSQRRPEAAAAALKQYLRQEPKDSAARADLGYALSDAGKWKQAAAAFADAARIEEAKREPAFRSAGTADLLCELATQPALSANDVAPQSAQTPETASVHANADMKAPSDPAQVSRNTSAAGENASGDKRSVPVQQLPMPNGIAPQPKQGSSEIDPDMLAPLSFAGGQR